MVQASKGPIRCNLIAAWLGTSFMVAVITIEKVVPKNSLHNLIDHIDFGISDG